jgi:hypothetical protein
MQDMQDHGMPVDECLTKGISSLDLRKECNKELQEIGEDDYYADAEYFELCILFLLAEIEELEMQDMQDHGMPVDECLPPLSAGTDTLARNKTLSPELKNALSLSRRQVQFPTQVWDTTQGRYKPRNWGSKIQKRFT